MLQYSYKLLKSGRWKHFPCYVLNRWIWNLSLHAGSTRDVLDAGSTGDTAGFFFLVGGIFDKSLFEINSKIRVSSSWILMRMDPLLTLLYKTWLFSSDKVKMTIKEARQSSTITTLTSHITWQVLVLALSYLHLHMIWVIEHGCVEVIACGPLVLSSQWMRHCSTSWFRSNGQILWPSRVWDHLHVFQWIFPDSIR